LPVKIWLPDHPARESIGELPATAELSLIPREGPLPPDFDAVEFLVPPYGSRRVLDALPRLDSLRVVQTNSAGVDWLLPFIPADVTLCSARGVRDVPVAEWVMAVILDAYKDLSRFRRQQDEGHWEAHMPRELGRSQALIVGYGSIGRALEERLRWFGVKIDRVARRPRPGVSGPEELDDLLPGADIVVLLLPADPSTVGLFDRQRLARIKPGALLVNAGRGSAVDTEALVEVLGTGRIRAALDVTDLEPLPPEHQLWRQPGVLITPHIAGDSDAAERRVYELVGEQVRRHLRGEPLQNVVDA
jgi:phosphoglycerate dehydrogenase-like enzyme